MEYDEICIKLNRFIQFYNGNGTLKSGEPLPGANVIIKQYRSGKIQCCNWSLYLLPNNLKSDDFGDMFQIKGVGIDAFIQCAYLSQTCCDLLTEISFQLRSVVKAIHLIPCKVDIVWIYHSCTLINARCIRDSPLLEITDRVARQLSREAKLYMVEFIQKNKLL